MLLYQCVVGVQQYMSPSEPSLASFSLCVFQQRQNVFPCSASLVVIWRDWERWAVCVPLASIWLQTTRPVKVVLPQKHISLNYCRCTCFPLFMGIFGLIITPKLHFDFLNYSVYTLFIFRRGYCLAR